MLRKKTAQCRFSLGKGNSEKTRLVKENPTVVIIDYFKLV